MRPAPVLAILMLVAVTGPAIAGLAPAPVERPQAWLRITDSQEHGLSVEQLATPQPAHTGGSGEASVSCQGLAPQETECRNDHIPPGHDKTQYALVPICPFGCYHGVLSSVVYGTDGNAREWTCEITWIGPVSDVGYIVDETVGVLGGAAYEWDCRAFGTWPGPVPLLQVCNSWEDRARSTAGGTGGFGCRLTYTPH